MICTACSPSRSSPTAISPTTRLRSTPAFPTTTRRELHRSILANPYLPAHLREQAANDRSEYCRAEDDDDLLEIDRLTDPGLVRFYIESGSASMHVDVPEDTARSIAYWILDHTNA